MFSHQTYYKTGLIKMYQLGNNAADIEKKSIQNADLKTLVSDVSKCGLHDCGSTPGKVSEINLPHRAKTDSKPDNLPI